MNWRIDQAEFPAWYSAHCGPLRAVTSARSFEGVASYASVMGPALRIAILLVCRWLWSLTLILNVKNRIDQAEIFTQHVAHQRQLNAETSARSTSGLTSNGTYGFPILRVFSDIWRLPTTGGYQAPANRMHTWEIGVSPMIYYITVCLSRYEPEKYRFPSKTSRYPRFCDSETNRLNYCFCLAMMDVRPQQIVCILEK